MDRHNHLQLRVIRIAHNPEACDRCLPSQGKCKIDNAEFPDLVVAGCPEDCERMVASEDGRTWSLHDFFLINDHVSTFWVNAEELDV